MHMHVLVVVVVVKLPSKTSSCGDGFSAISCIDSFLLPCMPDLNN